MPMLWLPITILLIFPDRFFFDVILTDVPCSGEGMFRKDPGAIEEWSPENVEICWQRQRRIITDIWPCLEAGRNPDIQ